MIFNAKGFSKEADICCGNSSINKKKVGAYHEEVCNARQAKQEGS